MPYDAFISYSSKDKPIADAACATLESRGVRCWIAPRDILPGEEWPAAIINGITQSRVMVLIYSGSANESPQIKRELERAVSGNKPILPFRLEATPMSPSLQYLISTPHWLDAMNPPMEAHLKRLGDTAVALLAGMDGPRASSGTSAQPADGAKAPRVDYATPTPKRAGGPSRTTLVAAGLILLVIVAGAGWRLSSGSAQQGGGGGGGGPVGSATGGPGVGGPATPPAPAPAAVPVPTPPSGDEPNVGRDRGEIFAKNGDDYVGAGRYAEAVLEYEGALREFPTLPGVAQKLSKATALAEAAKHPKPRVVLEPLIFAAVRGNNLEAARDMIARDQSTVAARDSAGDTPLHTLAASPDGTWQMARLLLDNNADPHAADAQGRTPLDRAKASGNTKVRAILEQVLTTRPSPRK